MSTSPRAPDSVAEAAIDPAWWADLMLSEEGPDGLHEPPERLSLELERRARSAVDTAGEESLQARVLTALAKATSPILEPENWTDPFKPMLQISTGRSVLPQDLSEAEIVMLHQILPLIFGQPVLRARVADVLWCRDRSDQKMWKAAVESYFEVPLEIESWLRSAHDGYRRGLELALRRGAPGHELAEALAHRLHAYLVSTVASDSWMAVEVSELLSKARRSTPQQAIELANRLSGLADGASLPHVGRACALEAARWFNRAPDLDRAHAMSEVIAELYVEEAESRGHSDGGGFVAGHFVEKAVQVLRGLPRKYRADRGIERWLRTLQAELAELRQGSLEQMSVIKTDPIDISDFIAQIKAHVAGRTRLEALVAVSDCAHPVDLDQAMADERERFTGSIARILGAETYSHDARKVAVRSGVGGGGPSDQQVLDELIASFAMRLNLVVAAQVHPALQTATYEHRYDLGFLTRLCQESPFVPQGHEELWARGLRHGLSGDLPSAVSVLVPQLEEMIRRLLKQAGAYTLHVEDDGVQKEKALGGLLVMEEATKLLGASLAFELRALLCEQLGPNLRNDLAHGLLTDAQSRGGAALYAWWHCLRLVVLPYWQMVQPDEDPPEAAPAEGEG